MNPAALLARLRAAGFYLDGDGAGGWELVPAVKGAGAAVPDDLRDALKRHREAVIAFVECRVCGRRTHDEDEEDRERLRGVNPWCDRATCPHKQRGT